MAHVEPEGLAALVLGEDDTPPEVTAHVEACAECRSLVESLVDVRRAAGADALVPPPPGLRERVLAATGQATAEPVGVATDPAADRPTVLRPRRGVPAWAAGLAAAVTLVGGIGLGQALGRADSPSPDPDPTVLAATDLTTVGGTDPRGLARVEQADGAVVLHVEAAALEDDGELREVWLLNLDGTRMVSVGFLAVGDEGDFDVPQRLLDEGYRIVDISVEPDDGDPTHSGVSVARGELT
ncbi:anti-sigma factor [Nocardioides piscis]|uniref:Anti-sigma K factor RskA C-terminal domain-containing protein n=1 Tax=Nocardioides piscis TaxID=2714938 RepID=A0A6G7YFB0_9ACTN|nr:anti-sigma factor [Nocardioides piscis]QIK75331.1 hypothetical protein G7071_07695 [Nocardioides piscis]